MAWEKALEAPVLTNALGRGLSGSGSTTHLPPEHVVHEGAASAVCSLLAMQVSILRLLDQKFDSMPECIAAPRAHSRFCHVRRFPGFLAGAMRP